MRRSKPDLSDWIKYLISQRNIGFTIGAILISVFFVVFGLILAYEKQIQPELNNTFIVIEFLLIILLSYAIWFKLLKATKLLKKIMKGEILDPKEIREEWFEK